MNIFYKVANFIFTVFIFNIMNITNYNQPTLLGINNNYAQNSMAFRGHAGHEILKQGKDVLLLRHETAFFREYNTLNKSVNYIRQHFPKEKSPKIIVGACSTGEEALSFKMLMPDKTPKILGFDISPTSVNEAKHSTYTISQPKNTKSRQFIDNMGIDAYKDEYLGFEPNNDKKVTRNQKRLKELFNKTFEERPTDEKPKKINLIKKALDFIKSKLSLDIDPDLNTKTFVVKNPKDTGCKFVQGDIQHLDEIAPKGEAHAISFRNALYHLVTNDISGGAYRETKPRAEAKPILTQVAKQVNKALTKDGIFILGECENSQLTDTKLLSEVLLENGFKKAVKDKNGYCNIWTKVSEID